MFALATYALMLLAAYYARYRALHMPLMAVVIVSDLFFPVYLYVTRNWYRRLIEHAEIFSFLIWMHFILVITLFMLYFVQVQTARGLLRGADGARGAHRSQAIGILITRALVILTGALLVEPEGDAGA
jgi:hypothetical protein